MNLITHAKCPFQILSASANILGSIDGGEASKDAKTKKQSQDVQL